MRDGYELSLLEAQLLDIIENKILAAGRGPTQQEMSELLGGSRSPRRIYALVDSLAKKNYIKKGHKMTSMRVIENPNRENTSCMPRVGKIAAGQPILAWEDVERVDLNDMFGGMGRYILDVVGDSMKKVGIYDGDLVVIEQQRPASTGDIVVALIDNTEATLKRFKQNYDKSVTLIPENDELDVMTYPAHRVQIQGVLVAQLRRY
ncbi:transcriptional repressor LexA [Piscirickettsia litoralis]|uniref:Repressor LexA n=1 Tax=Piscirickettsia litoralis TaxID=1891921 RepID=A0ABX3A7F7_9GAMM|nr:transcriptional repressor LexA [Piscirickettsia litoralis]ODN42029.1 repressor LexA [Piscirickettsia litoralis]